MENYLEKAVINLTIENAKLKEEVEKEKERGDLWYRSFKREEEKVKKLEKELSTLQLPSVTNEINQ